MVVQWYLTCGHAIRSQILTDTFRMSICILFIMFTILLGGFLSRIHAAANRSFGRFKSRTLGLRHS